MPPLEWRHFENNTRHEYFTAKRAMEDLNINDIEDGIDPRMYQTNKKRDDKSSVARSPSKEKDMTSQILPYSNCISLKNNPSEVRGIVPSVPSPVVPSNTKLKNNNYVNSQFRNNNLQLNED